MLYLPCHRRSEEHAVIGILFVAVFCAVGFAYASTEYAMTRFDVRQRVTIGEGGLPLILGVNCLSLLLLWICASILVAASGHQLYLQVMLISFAAQAVWLSQHLWFYYRDHLRVRFEYGSE
jgi:hypothetical protein